MEVKIVITNPGDTPVEVTLRPQGDTKRFAKWGTKDGIIATVYIPKS